MIPYAEKIVSDFLRTHAAVVALGARVVAKTPPATEEAWVRVTKLDARNAGSRIEHLIDFMLQFDCYASADNGVPEASVLGRTVRAALHDDLPGAPVSGGAVVTAVTISGDARIPDTTFAPARERIVLTAFVFIHP